MSVSGPELRVDGQPLLHKPGSCPCCGHVDGILNYCRTKVPMVVGGVNGNIKALFRRGRGHENLRYLLPRAQPAAATRIQFLVLQKAA